MMEKLRVIWWSMVLPEKARTKVCEAPTLLSFVGKIRNP